MHINRTHILDLWKSCKIKTDRLNEMKNLADKIVGFRESFYDPVQRETGVPWYVVGVIDCREEDFDHHGYLGNGDRFDRVTRHVPRGRGPFSSWFEGAIDAFHIDGMAHLPEGGHWDIVTALIKCEAFNGMGYAAMGLRSPYVWGATNNQQLGKYVSDGHFDRGALDRQPGCAAMFLALKQFHSVDLKEA